MIEYHRDGELDLRLRHIVERLGMSHIDISRVIAVRSRGSKSRRVLARCHTLSRVFQKALGVGSHYIIEVVSENFDRLSQEDRTRTLIHELMHIPKSFGGGFRHHRPYVNRRTVERAYQRYLASGC